MASTEIHILQSTDHVIEWCTTFNFIAHLVAYVATIAVLGLVLLLIVRLLSVFEEDTSIDDFESIETNPLIRPEKNVVVSYGTICEEDLEKGNSSSGSDSSNSTSISSSSGPSEDLYDGRLCVICYDEQRDCFFVPCGHCATCYVCADRIFYGENKTCPVCRRLIGKVRRLFAAI